jgi:hypothetical protein
VKRKSTALAGVALSLAVSVVGLGSDVTVGTWKLSLAKSAYNPGPPPKSSVVKIEAVGDQVKITTDLVDAQGKLTHDEWVGRYDGKDYPAIGNPNYDSRFYRKIDGYTFDTSAKKEGKIRTTSKLVYSRDGKTRSITTTGLNVKGQEISQTVVYDRQ